MVMPGSLSHGRGSFECCDGKTSRDKAQDKARQGHIRRCRGSFTFNLCLHSQSAESLSS